MCFLICSCLSLAKRCHGGKSAFISHSVSKLVLPKPYLAIITSHLTLCSPRAHSSCITFVFDPQFSMSCTGIVTSSCFDILVKDRGILFLLLAQKSCPFLPLRKLLQSMWNCLIFEECVPLKVFDICLHHLQQSLCPIERWP